VKRHPNPIYKRGETYWMFKTINGQRLDCSLKTKNFKLAQERYEKILADAYAGHFGTKKKKRITLAVLIERYYTQCATSDKPSTYAKKRFNLNNALNFFGDIPLSSLDQQLFDDFKFTRAKIVTKSTVNHDLTELKHILRLAFEWGYLSTDLGKFIKKFKLSEGKTRYLELAEIQALLRECSTELKPIVQMALNTGMRLGEVLKLTWDDVDLKNRIVILVDTKNRTTRSVPINSVLFEVLSQIDPKQGSVFKSRLGKPYKSIHTGFRSALQKAGIKDCTFHTLRHTFASHLAMKGISALILADLLGHKTLAMTRRYTHLSKGHQESVVELMAEFTRVN
jgi:integrase